MKYLLPGLLLALLAGPAAAQSIEINSANVGLPPGAHVGARNENGTAAHVAKNNLWAPVYVTLTLKREIKTPAAIVIEAALSFLGFGTPPPTPTWGGMLRGEGRRSLETVPYLAMFPGLAISIVVLALNMFGDAVRDLLDPRLRTR